MPDNRWDQVAAGAAPSWYLDPLVAAQKKQVHLQFFREWLPADARRVLKTDLFEEAFGEDRLLPELIAASPVFRTWIGMDFSPSIARHARSSMQLSCVSVLSADLRCLPFDSGSLDAILSNSTLDHFETQSEFEAAIGELARALRPGGRLMVTVDNSRNPLYLVLRWISQFRWAPFPLGYSTSRKGLQKVLEGAGLRVIATGRILHNPRLLSTALVLLLRRWLGLRADRPIQWLLNRFAALERLPTREFTACFCVSLLPFGKVITG